MTISNAHRASGWSLVAAGVLIAVVESYERLGIATDDRLSAHFLRGEVRVVEALSWLYMFLLLIGLPALHAHHRAKLGRLGDAAYVTLFATLTLTMGSLWSAVAVFPEVSRVDPAWVDALAGQSAPPVFGVVLIVSLFGPLLGLAAYGALAIRAGAFPRLAWMLAIAGFVALPFVPVLPPVAAGAGFVWLGRTLTGAGETPLVR